MPFEPGNTFGKGRIAGSRNKIKRLVAALEEIGFDPLAFALDKISKADENKQADLAMDLLAMVYGKPTVEKITASTPEESVESADILMKQLQDLAKPLEPKDA
jgi:hypothetical protein